MALHGRDAELRAVSSALEAARAGAPRPLVVVGEPGIGKTALLGAAEALARDAGLLVLRSRAVERERVLPFALAAATLDDPAGEAGSPALDAVNALGPALAGPAERFRYHRALRALVDDVADGRPFALLL